VRGASAGIPAGAWAAVLLTEAAAASAVWLKNSRRELDAAWSTWACLSKGTLPILERSRWSGLDESLDGAVGDAGRFCASAALQSSLALQLEKKLQATTDSAPL
jgi:hypothetical protein